LLSNKDTKLKRRRRRRIVYVTALAENGRTWLAELGRTLRSRD